MRLNRLQFVVALAVTGALLGACELPDPDRPPAASVASLPQPIVHGISEIDRDGNRVDDSIDEQVRTAQAVLQDAASTEPQKAEALSSLEEEIPVEFNFGRQVTPEELDQFRRMGGRVTWVYQAVGYGWNGVLPRGKIHDAANSIGPGFNGVIGAVPMQRHLHVATRTGRVRQQWAAGYSGSSNTTIAILDSGISSNGAAGGQVHRDLRGRQQFWKDYTSDRAPFPRDIIEHGSHVAGIALGTGEAGGVNPVTLTYSHSGHFLPDSSGGFNASTVEIPTPSGGSGAQNFSWNASVVWGAPGLGRTAGLTFGLYDAGYYPLTSQARDSTGHFSHQSAANWPQGIPVPFVGHAGDHSLNSSLFTNIMEKAGGTDWGSPEPSRRYSVTTRLSALNGHRFQLGDEFPFWRGVAPNCKWAGFRVFDDQGSGTHLSLAAALDDLAVQAAGNNIKVANMSLGFGGALQSIRDKTNNAVNAGVFIAVSAGNDGPRGVMGDPGRAGKAMTVAAASSLNQLTDYTSLGFDHGMLEQGEDAIKPDIVAPGGSRYRGAVVSVDSNDADAEDRTFPDANPDDYQAKHGTSMASPFMAGVAALVIDAWERAGHAWRFGSDSDPLFIKMLLSATATETNQQREFDPATSGPGINNPTLGRAAAPKDKAEGYGMVNVDAAIECIRRPLPGSSAQEVLGDARFDKRASCFSVSLVQGSRRTFNLQVPSGADYDLYLYSSRPGTNGAPIILAASAQPGLGIAELIQYTPTATETGYLVVKKVSGAGAFQLAGGSSSTGARPPTLASVDPSAGSIRGGTAVTLRGADFVAGATVTFGGIPVTGSVTSATSIGVNSPAHSAGAVDIVLTNPDGQSSTLSGAFTYLDSPTLASIAPFSGSTAGGTSVTLTGANFVSGAVVRFGSQAATDVTFVNASTLRAITPPQSAGWVDVSVSNPDGGTAVLAGAFQYSKVESSPGGSKGGCSSSANVAPLAPLALLVLCRLAHSANRRARRSLGRWQ